MHLDRTRAIAPGRLTAALVIFGAMVGCARSPSSSTAAPGSPSGARACVTAVVEHSACALPPHRAMEPGAPPTPAPSVR